LRGLHETASLASCWLQAVAGHLLENLSKDRPMDHLMIVVAMFL
jgi:hypothetical protein